MELSILLLGQMLSMMLMILMGFAAVKTKLVKSSQSSVISALTLYIIVPCVVIDSFQIEFSAEKMKGLLLAAGFAVLMHVLFIIVVGLLGKKWNMSPIEKASVIYSNGGNIIIPLVSALLGQEQVFYCCAFIMVQTFFFWTHTVGLIGGRSQISVKKILGNPNVIAIAIVLILFFTNTKLPGVLGDTVSSMGGIVGPVCMLMIGMIMAAADLKTVFLSGRNWLVCAGRLLFCPALMILVLWISKVTVTIPFGKDVLLILFLAIAAPVAATVTPMARLFHNHEEQAGAVNVMSVILSILTMPVMVAFYQKIL